MKHFYSHLIEFEPLVFELDNLNLSKNEKLHLAHLVDSNLHHNVLDAVLSELGENDKRLFLEHLALGDHFKIWEFLKNKVDNIEAKIKKVAEELKEELHKDINISKRSFPFASAKRKKLNSPPGARSQN